MKNLYIRRRFKLKVILVINFGTNLNTSALQVKPAANGISNMTVPFGNSAGDSQVPATTCTAAECLDASGRCHVNMSSQKNKQQSLEEYVEILRKQGKIEGKDFKIEGSPLYDNYNLYEYDEQGHEIKTNYWCNGNQASNKSGYDITEYENGVRTVKSYRTEGDLWYASYKYPNVLKEDLEESKWRDMSAEDYCKYLESQGKVKGKDYGIEKQTHEYEDGEPYQQIFVDEFSPSGVRKKTMWWIVSKDKSDLTISYGDENGKEIIRHSYNADNTSEHTFYYKKGEKV